MKKNTYYSHQACFSPWQGEHISYRKRISLFSNLGFYQRHLTLCVVSSPLVTFQMLSVGKCIYVICLSHRITTTPPQKIKIKTLLQFQGVSVSPWSSYEHMLQMEVLKHGNSWTVLPTSTVKLLLWLLEITQAIEVWAFWDLGRQEKMLRMWSCEMDLWLVLGLLLKIVLGCSEST